MTPFRPRASYAAAIRVVNVAHGRLTPEQQSRVEVVDDTALNAALLGDDDDRAFAAVEDWKMRQLAAIEEAAR